MTEMSAPALLAPLDALLRADAAVRALLVVGSVARGTADCWSDLDVVVVVADAALAAFDPATRWMGQIGEVLAFEHSSGAGRGTTRTWLEQGRLDVVVATETCFAAEGGWPLWDGIAVRFSRSPRVDQVVAAPHVRPAAQMLMPDAFAVLVKQFWFQALVALTKVISGQPAGDVLDARAAPREQRERHILEHYYRTLVAHGVQAYSWGDLLADYRAGLIFWLLMPVQDGGDGAPHSYWWPKMQCLLAAFDDWGCADLLG